MAALLDRYRHLRLQLLGGVLGLFAIDVISMRQWVKDLPFVVSSIRTFRRYRPFTMIAISTYVDNLALARRVRGVDGCVVECGVWRGGMVAGIADVLGRDRTYHLFDSFEGLPEVSELDGQAALQWQQAQDDTESPQFLDNCAAEVGFAEEAMGLSDATQVQLHQGWFSDTLPSFEPGTGIALLRLDGDWYESTLTCLEALFPRVVPGGMIIVDDYITWDGCAKAVHDYLSANKRPERIQRSSRGVTYLVKSAG